MKLHDPAPIASLALAVTLAVGALAAVPHTDSFLDHPDEHASARPGK